MKMDRDSTYYRGVKVGLERPMWGKGDICNPVNNKDLKKMDWDSAKAGNDVPCEGSTFKVYICTCCFDPSQYL